MTIARLRPAHTDDELHTIYMKPHDHRRFGRGHGERVAKMIEMISSTTWASAADLSCGNGAVLDAINSEVKIYGDFARGYTVTGAIENTIHNLPDVDLFVLGETLEHLDDPGKVLRLIARRANWLLMSTPIEAWDDTNAEHYWAWDRDGVEELLHQATISFDVVAFDVVDTRVYQEPYCYGVWLIKL
jgi:hypothetical protein